jgi:hypothetical protein
LSAASPASSRPTPTRITNIDPDILIAPHYIYSQTGLPTIVHG